MALKEFVGAISLEVDGREIEVATVSPRESTGRKPVRVMTKLGTIAGFSRGIKTYDLRLTAVVPDDGQPVNWANIEGAKVSLEPFDGGGQRVSYLDCFSTEVGEEYSVDNEARIDITMVAVRKVEE
jgi:hypothetical protein